MLLHILKKQYFFFPTQYMVFNARVFGCNFSAFCFQLDLFEQKVIKSSYDYKVWYFSLRVNLQNGCCFRFKLHPVGGVFFP